MKGFVPARSVVIPGSYTKASWRFSGSMRYKIIGKHQTCDMREFI
jgi:hypothetical protein